jgi:hypothetical protein
MMMLMAAARPLGRLPLPLLNVQSPVSSMKKSLTTGAGLRYRRLPRRVSDFFWEKSIAI